MPVRHNVAVVHIQGPVTSSDEVRTQIIAQIESGALAVGERLPSVRRLAEEIGLAPNTVAKAYRELEAAGWVITAGRKGTAVATRSSGRAEDAALALATDYVRRMRGLGFEVDAMVHFIHRTTEN